MTDKRIFIERRQDGLFSIEKPNLSRSSGLFLRQSDAIERARQMNPSQIDVERVRVTKKGKSDKWRKP